ncbi:MAG TPA: hypothetical protein PKW28_13560 [Turneriella sp.]|nr:hypothetical protein [Turneriella sp.]HNJ66921.1 hypothetical protein [Turneriella sp.]HNM99245.1 hypothetical protein [Turneriella sp.]
MPRATAWKYGLLLATVGAFALPNKAPVATSWISKNFVGGPRCVARGPASAFSPPGFESEQEKLGRQGIPVAQAYYRDLPTCQACEVCPNYRREILFEVRSADTDLAAKAGYNKVAAPESTELLEFQRSKIYRPPPDVPEND